MQLDLDASGEAKLFEDQLHLLRVISHSVDTVAVDGIAFAETADKFLIKAGLVEIEQIAEQRGRPDPAEGAVCFEEPNLGAGAGGGDRGGDTGRAGAADDHITVGGQGDVPLGLGEHARLRCRSALEFA